MMEYVIEPQKGKKGRSFCAYNVATVMANGLWPDAQGNEIRPVWAMFCGTESELKPFMTNLRLGRRAEPLGGGYRRSNAGERLEFLKTTGFYTSWQRETEGSIATIYHPELFRLDPGMVDPDGVRFVLLVPSDWISAQKVDVKAAVQHMRHFSHPLEEAQVASLAVTAHLFAAYLDRRTRCPIVADGRFYTQMLFAALELGMASIAGNRLRYPSHSREWGYSPSHGFQATGLEEARIETAISCRANHEDLERFLAEQVELFFEVTDKKTKRQLAKNTLVPSLVDL